MKSRPIMEPSNFQSPPSNHMSLSLLNLLCCCWPLGLLALMYSKKVDSALAQNDNETAWSYSNTAKWLNIVGITIGAFLLAGVLSFIIVYFTLLNPIGPGSHIRG